MSFVYIKNVWKYYGDFVAVSDFTLKCNENEFVCLLGPSGCGKSSTLRMLAGLEHISAGDVFFGDRRINDLPPKERNIAMVFENYALYPHKTVFENIANPLRLTKMSNDQIRKKVKYASDLLQISELLDRRPASLSGGQKQRVAIGRAIVREPFVFLFDEPIAHLDAALRARMRGELRHLQRRLGTTTIHVTHDQLEALSMADRIAVMHLGVLQQFDTPREVYENPVNAWVANFVGEPPMNIIEMTVADGDGGRSVAHEAFQLAVPKTRLEAVRSLQDGDKVQIGVRPDKLSVALNADGGTMEGRIFATELLGSNMLVEVQVRDERFRVMAAPDFPGEIDDLCHLHLDINNCHFFSMEDGSALR